MAAPITCKHPPIIASFRRGFLEDGRVGIDKKPAERALRPIGIGRKNWLFAGADTGAETLARAMTIIETAKMHVSVV